MKNWGGILNSSEEGKIWKGNKELIREESAESQLHAIQEESENDFGTVISDDFGNSGTRAPFWNSRKPTLMKRCWVALNWEGGTIIIGDFGWVVEDGRLELREEPVRCDK